MSFSFPPATKFAPNSRNDAFLARNAASIRAEWGKPRSSARSRTIYLNFAFIVALCDYLYSCSGAAPLCLSNSNPSSCSRGAVKGTTISEVLIGSQRGNARTREA